MYNVQCPISLIKATDAYANRTMYALNHKRDEYDVFVMILKTRNL